MKTLTALGTVILITLVTACTDVRLLPTNNLLALSVSSAGQFCTSDPAYLQRLNKFLFIVDKSGSNAWTDPEAVQRQGNIEDFVKKSDTASTAFGLIEFHDGAAHSLVIDPDSKKAGFTNQRPIILEATGHLKSDRDMGDTPYKAALEQARVVIENDIAAHPEQQSYYNIIFVSDGGPTDLADIPEAEGLVLSLMKLSPGYLFLSAALYGEDARNGIDPIEVMQAMAKSGGGRFINFQSGPWDLESLVILPSVQPWQMKSFLIYNLNAAFCFDGLADVDSDIDGLCDRDEGELGFDPENRFSKGDGYGDYFHWREVKYGETLPPCTDQMDDDHDLLTTCEEAYIRNDKPSMGIPKNGDPKNPDTDGDGVLDGIETFVYMSRTMAMAMDSLNLAFNNYDGEEPAGLQIQQHRNPLVKDAGAPRYDTTIAPTRAGPGVIGDCYSMRQNILPLYSTRAVKPVQTLSGLEHQKGENVVLIYYIETAQSDPTGKGVLRFTYQRMKFGVGAQLSFSDRQMQTYTPPIQ